MIDDDDFRGVRPLWAQLPVQLITPFPLHLEGGLDIFPLVFPIKGNLVSSRGFQILRIVE